MKQCHRHHVTGHHDREGARDRDKSEDLPFHTWKSPTGLWVGLLTDAKAGAARRHIVFTGHSVSFQNITHIPLTYPDRYFGGFSVLCLI